MSSLRQQNQQVERPNRSQHQISRSCNFADDEMCATQPTEVPELSTLLPAIFVPIEQDFLQPIEKAQDRIELLRRMQISLDANEKAVRSNFVWMFEREARRCLKEASKTGSLASPHEPKPITWEEGDMLLANLEEPATPNQTYQLSSSEIERFNAYPVNTGLEQLSPHEKAIRDLLIVVQRGSRDIEGYSKRHIKEIRDRLNNSLEKEREDELGMFVS